MKDMIYSYRLTYFGGTAPCDDGDFLSLAICKRDMRRVMGRKFKKLEKSGEEGNLWFIGIVGSKLAPELQKISSKNQHKSDEILYIAKLTGVELFEEYFSKRRPKRKDRIYIPAPKDPGMKVKVYEAGGERFVHNTEETSVHDEPWLQDRDWDVDHSGGKYVLLSGQYAYIKPGDPINGLLKGMLAKSQGHKPAEVDDPIVDELKRLTCSPDHGKEYRPEIQDEKSCKGCGKDKAI